MAKQAHQFLTALSYGDAIGDYTLEIQRILRARGYDSEIFSEVVHPQMARFVKPLHEYERYQADDVGMVVHFSIGSYLGNVIPHYKGKKLLIYHNITPHEWFVDINALLAYQCLVGRKQLEYLQPFCPVSLGDSEYNRQELEAAGFTNTGVLPIKLDFSKFDGPHDPMTMKIYDDHRTNIVVVGRAIPNKKLEDCLKAFSYYQKFINPLSRLIFVGMWSGFDRYYYALRRLSADLQTQEVVFTGHINFQELLAFYRIADVMMTMSEHEGFCVPVLEAFYMKVPVIAWGACAIPYTAGKGAILFNTEKNYAEIAEMIHQLSADSKLRESVIASQQKQLDDHANFPFEETLIRSLDLLEKTAPVRIEDVVELTPETLKRKAELAALQK